MMRKHVSNHQTLARSIKIVRVSNRPIMESVQNSKVNNQLKMPN